MKENSNRAAGERCFVAAKFPAQTPRMAKKSAANSTAVSSRLPQVVTSQFREAEKRRAMRVLVMVHELHKAGYQKLRICPGMSPSGCNWRCAVTPAENIESKHGAMLKDWDKDVAAYTSGQKNEYFGWKDAKADTARELAVKFIKRFPNIAKGGLGEDWEYAGWYVQMLGFAERGEFPVAYADWWEEPDPRWLPTDKGIKSNLPMPPLTPRSSTR